MLATTRPYYRSMYVGVVRDGPLNTLASFDDPRLSELKIAVQLIGDDGSNTPPAHALSSRKTIRNIRGFTILAIINPARHSLRSSTPLPATMSMSLMSGDQPLAISPDASA